MPIVKAMCTDLGFDVAVTGVQIFGGYGFTQEFPVEQLVRDAKIQSIYEGTNGIQALDLLGRKMRMEGGRLFMEWMQDAKAEIEAAQAEGFERQATELGKAVDAVAAAAMHIAGLGQKDIDQAMVHAVPFMQAFGYVVLGQEALDQARVAKRKIAETSETNFLKGKLLNLDHFTATFLPHVTATSKAIRTERLELPGPQLVCVVVGGSVPRTKEGPHRGPFFCGPKPAFGRPNTWSLAELLVHQTFDAGECEIARSWPGPRVEIDSCSTERISHAYLDESGDAE